MAYVIAAPEMMAAAAADLAAIGSNVSAAHLVAAARTTSVIPAAADEVSAAIASVFANHAQAFQGLAGKAAAFHDQFVQTLNSGGAAYAQTEATSAPGLRALFSLLPPGIQNDLQLLPTPFDVFAFAFFFTIAAFVIFNLAIGLLLFLLFHPQQLLQLLMALPQQLLQLLMMLGL
jgi:PE family